MSETREKLLLVNSESPDTTSNSDDEIQHVPPLQPANLRRKRKQGELPPVYNVDNWKEQI